MKKILLVINILALTFLLSNCTSSSNEEDALVEEGTTAEASTDEAAVSEEAPKSDEVAATTETGEEAPAVTEDKKEEEFSEELPAEDNSNMVASETVQPVENTDQAAVAPTEQAPADQVPVDQQAVAAGVDTGEQPPQDVPPADVQTPVDTATTETPATDSTLSSTPTEFASAPTEEVKKALPSLKKVNTETYRAGGQLINGVYVARPGDDFKSISQMIYGTPDKHKDLAKANSWMKSPKPGDKVYYNSPTRPDDKSKILSYYEEQSITPETYVTQEGENLKTVSEKLLGYPNAWKETWATNLMIESKGDLPAGTEIKYWKTASSSPSPHNELAQQAPPEINPQMEAPPAPPVAENPPPPMEQLPPPMEAPAPQDMAMAPPPVEAPPAIEPPPPVPHDFNKKPANEGNEEVAAAGMDNDMMMNIGAGALVLVGGVFFVMIRRKKSREKAIADAFDSTQVG